MHPSIPPLLHVTLERGRSLTMLTDIRAMRPGAL